MKPKLGRPAKLNIKKQIFELNDKGLNDVEIAIKVYGDKSKKQLVQYHRSTYLKKFSTFESMDKEITKV